MLISVTPTTDFINTGHNLTYLEGTVLGEQLGMEGNDRIILTN